MAKAIYNPALASVDEHSATSATFLVEPLHMGYGNTLGNSLRRVLLSSVRGGAIVAFRIDGVSHEFTTVPGIKEDVVDIMLNLKGVRHASCCRVCYRSPCEGVLRGKLHWLLNAHQRLLVLDCKLLLP
jgi:DNA-directed RNA polymerase alpha subunit